MSDPYRYPYVAPWLGSTEPGCPHVAPYGCPRCDGTVEDERAMNAARRERLARVRHLMRTSREYRRDWLISLPREHRAGLGGYADRTHGVMPGLLAEVEEATRDDQA